MGPKAPEWQQKVRGAGRGCLKESAKWTDMRTRSLAVEALVKGTGVMGHLQTRQAPTGLHTCVARVGEEEALDPPLQTAHLLRPLSLCVCSLCSTACSALLCFVQYHLLSVQSLLLCPLPSGCTFLIAAAPSSPALLLGARGL